MSTETSELFFGLLTLSADVAVVVLLVARLVGARWFLEPVADVALPFACAVALTCTVGSLYFSEVADFVAVHVVLVPAHRDVPARRHVAHCDASSRP
jgi:hypothetical protein